MARIVDYTEIPLTDLVIGKAQVRMLNVGHGIDELAENIRKIGLLHPILVCPSDQPGKFEILLGQRRFLAHQYLQLKSIRCAVFDQPVDPITAKVVSLSENMVRRGLDRNDLIDVCTSLYKHYGSVNAVAETTGLPAREVSLYVKYERLIPELKDLVDTGEVELKTALKAQDAASLTGRVDPTEAVMFAKEMQPMSGANQRRLVEIKQQNPRESATRVIEKAKTGDKLTQIIVTLSEPLRQSLQTFARDEGASQDEAAATLIEEGLLNRGFLDDADA